MAHQIVPITEIQRRARAAFAAGTPLSACPFNWHSSAYETWHAEYTRLEALAAAEECTPCAS